MLFKSVGYTEISRKLDVPLLNLQIGNMAKMAVPDNFVFMGQSSPPCTGRRCSRSIWSGSHVMGFETSEIDVFGWSSKAGMKPAALDGIEVVGEKLSEVRRSFEKPQVVPYSMISDWYGPPL